MTHKDYNGWTNYETWNVKLWIDNEEGSYRFWQEQAQHTYRWANGRGTGFTKEEQAVLDLAAMLKDEHESQWQDIMDAAGKHVHISASVWAGLMGAALSEVNWHEIAQHMIEDVDKDAPVEVQ